jgi:hypothetical protein
MRAFRRLSILIATAALVAGLAAASAVPAFAVAPAAERNVQLLCSALG